METPPIIRRQRPGAQVQQLSISVAREDMARLRKEAHRENVTLSLYIRTALRFFWAHKDQEAA